VYLSQRFCRAVAGAVPAIFAVLASVAAVGAMGTTSPSDAAAPATTLFGSAVYREPRTEPWPHAVAREDGLFVR
jgi:hypothetical protein